MREIFKTLFAVLSRTLFSCLYFYLALPFFIYASTALAEAPKAETAPKSDEEDFSETPFTEYAEFNEATEEASDVKFFQYGRFFGVSLGLGFQFVDGNRGALWQGGFPMVDFKVHYWFDFNMALDLGFYTAQHFFNSTDAQQHVDINMVRIGVDVKYYFPTKNLAAALSVSNPYVLIGAGAFTKTSLSNAAAVTDSDTSLGISVGAGLEFAVTPRKMYFEIEGKVHFVTFKDTYTSIYTTQGIPSLTGNFYTFSVNALFTW